MQCQRNLLNGTIVDTGIEGRLVIHMCDRKSIEPHRTILEKPLAYCVSTVVGDPRSIVMIVCIIQHNTHPSISFGMDYNR